MYPPSQFPDNLRRLEGFNWRGSEQLLSKEDIFKGEPPFELTKIQGIPLPEIEEDFFALPEDVEQRVLPAASGLNAEDLETRDQDNIPLSVPEQSKDTKAIRDALIERNTAKAKARAEEKKKDSVNTKPKGIKPNKDQTP